MDEAILAQDLVPWSPTGMLPALNLTTAPTGTTCLIGPQSDILAAYMRTLGGVELASKGKLRLLGHSLQELNKAQWQQLRPQLGFVTGAAPLLSVLNGLENVTLPALYHRRLQRSDAVQSAHRLLEELNCRADLTKLPAYLTLLERTQLAIARATILSPPVLFIEELFHGLSASEHHEIEPFLEDWARSNALIISTQSLRYVRSHASHIVFATAEKILYFDDWASLETCTDKAVQHYLQDYRDSYHI